MCLLATAVCWCVNARVCVCVESTGNGRKGVGPDPDRIARSTFRPCFASIWSIDPSTLQLVFHLAQISGPVDAVVLAFSVAKKKFRPVHLGTWLSWHRNRKEIFARRGFDCVELLTLVKRKLEISPLLFIGQRREHLFDPAINGKKLSLTVFNDQAIDQVVVIFSAWCSSQRPHSRLQSKSWIFYLKNYFNFTKRVCWIFIGHLLDTWQSIGSISGTNICAVNWVLELSGSWLRLLLFLFSYPVRSLGRHDLFPIFRTWPPENCIAGRTPPVQLGPAEWRGSGGGSRVCPGTTMNNHR